MATDLRIVIFTAYFYPGVRGGGPIRSITNLISRAPQGVTVRVITGDRDLSSRTPYPGLSGREVAFEGARVSYLPPRVRDWLRMLTSVRSFRPDVIYLNSLFERRFALLPLMAWWWGVLPSQFLLIAPRGELHPGALSLKPIRKQFTRLLLRPVLRHPRLLWHACSEPEATDIREWVPGAEVIVSPNIVELGDAAAQPGPAASEDLRAIFVGRVAKKKGVDLAISAMARVSGEARLDVYGPIEDGAYWRDCLELIATLPANVKVRHWGALDHREVSEAFAASDVFVFPTLGENFGHVVAEALAAGCPVLTTDTTPWTERLAAGGGWVVPRTADAFGRVLDELSRSRGSHRMSRRQAARSTFEEWRSQTGSPHLFELVQRRVIGG